MFNLSMTFIDPCLWVYSVIDPYLLMLIVVLSYWSCFPMFVCIICHSDLYLHEYAVSLIFTFLVSKISPVNSPFLAIYEWTAMSLDLTQLSYQMAPFDLFLFQKLKFWLKNHRLKFRIWRPTSKWLHKYFQKWKRLSAAYNFPRRLLQRGKCFSE